MRNAVLGALVGFALGWWMFGERAGPTRAGRADRVPFEERSALKTPAVPEEPRDPTPMDRSSGEAPEESVRAALQRIDAARQERDWNLFSSLIQLLAASSSPEAQQKLIELMGDPSLRFFDGNVAEDFVWGLSATELEGVAAAARARIEMELSRLHMELTRSESKLDCENLVARAPAAVVDKERARVAGFRDALARLQSQREALQG
jgi:valyl-tRNA synthetase